MLYGPEASQLESRNIEETVIYNNVLHKLVLGTEKSSEAAHINYIYCVQVLPGATISVAADPTDPI